MDAIRGIWLRMASITSSQRSLQGLGAACSSRRFPTAGDHDPAEVPTAGDHDPAELDREALWLVVSGGLLVASLPYTGLGEPESRGYLSVQMGALVKILPGTETAGGEGNMYPSYAYAEVLGDVMQFGWIPIAILHADHTP